MFSAVLQSCESELQSAQSILNKLLEPKKVRTEKNTLVPYNQVLIHLDASKSLPSLLSQVHPDAKIREEAETCEQKESRFATELSLNRDLYDAFKAVNPKKLSAGAKRVLDKTLREFKRAGIDQDEASRAKIKALEEELVLIGQAFDRNIRDDRRFIEVDAKTGLEGMPADYKASHPANAAGKVQISTDYPDYIPYMTYAQSAENRRQLWMLFNQRGYPANEPILKQMIQKRHALANLLGYSSYADYVVEDKMVKNTKRAAEFIQSIAEIAEKGAKQEYAIILAEKQKTEPDAKEVFPYERSYLEEKIKQARYQVDSQQVRSYFQFPAVRDGLMKLTSQLYGVSFKPVKNSEIWEPSVEVYDVWQKQKNLGRIYLDLHPRENKFKHAAQFTVKSGVKGKQLPAGALVCNFSKDLMDHDEVVTFFHEFGHLMHHVFGGQQKWIAFSGVATEWDFVEAPSQFFEEWAWDPKVLKTFSKIPPDLVAKMKSADEFGKGIDARRQMFLASLSLQYYLKDPNSFDPLELLKTLQTQYSDFAYVPETYLHLNFGHLHDYSAMYYTYMWSKVIAKDFLSAFTQNGLMDKKQAGRYRKYILEAGGTRDADELVSKFLGRPYQFEAFKNWLEERSQT